MRSSQVVRASGCQCECRNNLGFDPAYSDTVESDLGGRCSSIEKRTLKEKKPKKSPPPFNFNVTKIKSYYFIIGIRSLTIPSCAHLLCRSLYKIWGFCIYVHLNFGLQSSFFWLSFALFVWSLASNKEGTFTYTKSIKKQFIGLITFK